jgi:hypothetical protein
MKHSDVQRGIGPVYHPHSEVMLFPCQVKAQARHVGPVLLRPAAAPAGSVAVLRWQPGASARSSK